MTMVKINRRPGTQDISWFLDQHNLGRLDVDPPYQRRSVWTSKDRRYFLDTLFRGFPCPPVYLHKSIDKSGAAIYHVVDGKQRIETIIRFAEGRLRVPEEFGDERLNNKRWKDIVSETDIRNRFLNYPFVVEYFDDVDSSLVNEIFERMNKNSRKLTQQELRNARYDGWFSREVESEVNDGIWRKIGIATTGRARRMADVQFVAELLMVLLQKEIVGFDHSSIDDVYAAYDDMEEMEEVVQPFNEDIFRAELTAARDFLKRICDLKPEITGYLSSVSNTYILWATIVLDAEKLPEAEKFADIYADFMKQVSMIAEDKKRSDDAGPSVLAVSNAALEYFDANQSATTELPQRTKRLTALRKALEIEN